MLKKLIRQPHTRYAFIITLLAILIMLLGNGLVKDITTQNNCGDTLTCGLVLIGAISLIGIPIAFLVIILAATGLILVARDLIHYRALQTSDRLLALIVAGINVTILAYIIKIAGTLLHVQSLFK